MNVYRRMLPDDFDKPAAAMDAAAEGAKCQLSEAVGRI
jgi:hypothetical protein